jgi:hypothetical protein
VTCEFAGFVTEMLWNLTPHRIPLGFKLCLLLNGQVGKLHMLLTLQCFDFFLSHWVCSLESLRLLLLSHLRYSLCASELPHCLFITCLSRLGYTVVVDVSYSLFQFYLAELFEEVIDMDKRVILNDIL